MNTSLAQAATVSGMPPGSGASALSSLLPRAVAYEDWRCPLAPALRQGAQLAGLVASLLALVCVPFAVTTAHPVAIALAALEVAGVGLFLTTLIATHGLQSGSRAWHKVAYALVLTEAPQGFVVSVSVVAGVAAAIIAVALSLLVTWLFFEGMLGAAR